MSGDTVVSCNLYAVVFVEVDFMGLVTHFIPYIKLNLLSSSKWNEDDDPQSGLKISWHGHFRVNFGLERASVLIPFSAGKFLRTVFWVLFKSVHFTSPTLSSEQHDTAWIQQNRWIESLRKCVYFDSSYVRIYLSDLLSCIIEPLPKYRH